MFRLMRYERILIGNRRFEGVGQFRPNFHVVEDILRKLFLHR